MSKIQLDSVHTTENPLFQSLRSSIIASVVDTALSVRAPMGAEEAEQVYAKEIVRIEAQMSECMASTPPDFDSLAKLAQQRSNYTNHKEANLAQLQKGDEVLTLISTLPEDQRDEATTLYLLKRLADASAESYNERYNSLNESIKSVLPGSKRASSGKSRTTNGGKNTNSPRNDDGSSKNINNGGAWSMDDAAPRISALIGNVWPVSASMKDDGNVFYLNYAEKTFWADEECTQPAIFTYGGEEFVGNDTSIIYSKRCQAATAGAGQTRELILCIPGQDRAKVRFSEPIITAMEKAAQPAAQPATTPATK